MMESMGMMSYFFTPLLCLLGLFLLLRQIRVESNWYLKALLSIPAMILAGYTVYSLWLAIIVLVLMKAI